MNKTMRTIAVALTLLVFACSGSSRSQGLKVGTEAPDFKLADLAGNEVSLKEFRGKVVAIVFWASWCPHCRKEIPELIKLDREYRDKGLEMLAVSPRESAQKLKPFAEKNGITYRVLLDSKGEVSATYKIVGVPSLVIVDRGGVIKYSGIGLPEEAKKILKDLLKGDEKETGKKDSGK